MLERIRKLDAVIIEWHHARSGYLSLDWDRKDGAEFGKRQSRMQRAVIALEELAATAAQQEAGTA